VASKVVKGIVWSAIERFSVQGVSFVLSIVIARLVSPSAYGIIAILNVFLSFSQVFIDSGFGNALIQKNDRKEVDFSTTLIYSLGVAMTIYCILFIASPFIADFYNDSSLCLMLRCMSLNLIFSSISIVQRCRLTIDLDFKTQTKSSLLAVVSGGILGVVLAYNGFGAWGLVAQSIMSSFLTSVTLIYYSKWKPSFTFSKESFNRLFSFGSKQLVENIITSIYINLSNLVIGKYYSTSALGCYNRGFTLAQFPSTNIVGVLSRIIYPVECELQNDEQKLVEAHFKYMRLYCYIVFPLMALMCVLAKPLILVVLTEKWEAAAYYLSVMCLAFIWYPIVNHGPTLFAVKGMTGVSLMSAIPKRIVAFVLLFATLPFGAKAIAWSLVVSNINECFVNSCFLTKYAGLPFWKQYTVILDILVATCLAGAVSYMVSIVTLHPFLQLVFGGLSGVVTFLMLTFAFNMQEKSLWLFIFKRLKLIK
jgi:O-antigen/teichoic acid export membrane protein